jgi:hypothetical protein
MLANFLGNLLLLNYMVRLVGKHPFDLLKQLL